jgi:hypothetical protein
MPVTNALTACQAELEGRSRFTEWVKIVNQVTTAGLWYDVTGASGNPKSKQWFDATPLVAQQVTQSGDGGIYHGAALSGTATKYARKLRLQCVSATPLPLPFILMDYLLYYPSVEDGALEPQVMTNTLSLPRYTTGAGVQMMAVTISSRTGGQQFTVSYTNQDGVAGRTSQTATQNTAAAPGTVLTSATATAGAAGPFIGLQDGDTGVRSVQSVTMLGADTGFFSIVLVRPIAYSVVRSTDAVYEKDLLIMANELPEIQDDAFLSAVVLPQGSLSGVSIRGGLTTIWN